MKAAARRFRTADIARQDDIKELVARITWRDS